MKLHGNAALSWNGRRRLAELVVVEGCTLTAAAEAAGVSVRCPSRTRLRESVEEVTRRRRAARPAGATPCPRRWCKRPRSFRAYGGALDEERGG